MSLKTILAYNGTPVDDLSRDEAIAAIKWLAVELPGAPAPIRYDFGKPVLTDTPRPLRYCGTLVSEMSDCALMAAARVVAGQPVLIRDRDEAIAIIRNWREGSRSVRWKHDPARRQKPCCPFWP